jgi:hypothetical protein
MDLDRPVDHPQRHVRRHHLDLRDLALRHFVAHGVHHVRRFQGQQARHVDFHPRVGDLVDVAAQTRQGLPNAVRLTERLHINSRARSAMPIERMQW